ncbi:MAG TPA: extracellular solute-binding protein [Symbiobacteriaceae bacterium]|nr:extracellular solute-binding protein [Symbiobacteriaceae bacterium]
MVRRILAAAVILLTVSACAKPVVPPESRVAAPEQAFTTIKLAAMKGANEPELDLLIAAFQEQHPGYRVEKVLFDWTAQGRSKLLEAAMAGEVDVLRDNAVDYDRRGNVFRALDGFLAQGGLDQSRFGDLLEQMKLDGRVVELPYAAYPYLLVYNREKVQAAGVKIPADKWTWDEFRFALTKLTQGQGDAKVWGLDSQVHDDFIHMYLQQKYGVPIWQAKYDMLLDALGLFHTIAFTDGSMKPLTGQQITANGITRTLDWWGFRSLNEGGAAMTYEPAMSLAYYRSEIKVPWDVAPMPALPGTKPILRVRPRSLGIAFNSGQAEAAWKFVAFAGGPVGAELIARNGDIPVYLTEDVQKAWAGQNLPPGLASIWNATWRVAVEPPSPNGFGMRHMNADKAVLWTLSGEKSVEDAIGYFKDLP